MFRKLLIANRGEIAVRIIRACRELDVSPVAVYSAADRDALHVQLADEAVAIGPPPPRESYLLGERLIAAALTTGCAAIHPGYGFLAENADFADAVRTAGLIFVGPSGDAMRRLGAKTAARSAMAAAGVPVVPGYQASQEDHDLLAAGAALGFPLLVKATAGGGGKGMRRVEQAADLLPALAAARREALNAFGDGRIYLEKLILQPRHIEIQILADHHGHAVHLFERDCSLQRRHQKLVEESPSPGLSSDVRARMGAAGVAAVQAVGYTNAGTLEFLLTPAGDFYFLEMNTRLQVEHPVTEAVTGLDLVQLQLRIAAGEALPFDQAAISQRGHAIECRLCAEDPANGFLPSTGRIRHFAPPAGPGVRVETGVVSGDEISLYYDSLLAKIIVLAESRPAALARMRAALQRTVVLGEVNTNLPFLIDLLADSAVVAGDHHTGFVEEHWHAWQPAPPTAGEAELLLALAGVAEFLAAQPTTGADQPVTADGDPYSPWKSSDSFRLAAGPKDRP